MFRYSQKKKKQNRVRFARSFQRVPCYNKQYTYGCILLWINVAHTRVRVQWQRIRDVYIMYVGCCRTHLYTSTDNDYDEWRRKPRCSRDASAYHISRSGDRAAASVQRALIYNDNKLLIGPFVSEVVRALMSVRVCVCVCVCVCDIFSLGPHADYLQAINHPPGSNTTTSTST
jgi:hypothetical protein